MFAQETTLSVLFFLKKFCEPKVYSKFFFTNMFLLPLTSKCIGSFHFLRTHLNMRQALKKKVSITYTMLDVVTTIYDNIYENLILGLVLIDFQKTFHTVCHRTLSNWNIIECGEWYLIWSTLNFMIENNLSL